MPLQTDARRFAVYSDDGSVLVVRDTLSAKRREVPLGVGCVVADGTAGVFLLTCSDPAGDETPYVLDARTGDIVEAPGEGQSYFPGSDSFSAIGAQWLAGVNSGEGRVTTEYLNWHTGRVVGTDEGPGDPAVPRNLNASSLPALGSPGVYAVFQKVGRATVSETALTLSDPLTLRLDTRKRTRRRILLDSCNVGCSSVILGPKVITWASGQHVAHAYVIRRHRRLKWRFGGVLARNVGVQQTAKQIFVNVASAQGLTPGYRVYAVAMPR